MAFNNVRYGVLPSAPPSLSSLCILCRVPYSAHRVFPCDCSMPVHEECAIAIRRQGTFMCPSCMKTYTFPVYTPASSVMGDSIIYSSPLTSSGTRTEITCRRNRRSIYTSMFIFLLLVIVALALYIFLKYF